MHLLLNQVAQLELRDDGNGTVNASVIRTLSLPVPTGDPGDSQAEGIVVDQELGFLYVALEDQVGILKFLAEPNQGDQFTVIRSIDSPELTPDIEGLSIYYGPNGTGYLIANSQGDSSYAVYRRDGTNDYLGSFAIGDNGPIDQANESNGLDIINVPLGDAFPNGLLVVQDGANDPQNVVEDEEELENNSTNFKFVPYESVANAFDDPLIIDPVSYDPRNPQIIGDIGSDDQEGGRGNDTLLGGRGDDDLDGGRGDDSLVGSEGDDNVYGGRGSDFLYGNEGDDNLIGGRDDDTLVGGEGDDDLIGGKGNDLLTGNADSDLFILSAGEGIDTITDFNIDEDAIGLVGDLSFEDLIFEQGVGDQKADTLVTLAATSELLAVVNGVHVNAMTSMLFESVAI